MKDERLDELSFILDDREADQWIGLGRTEQRRRKHDRHVLRAHHVLLLVFRHPAADILLHIFHFVKTTVKKKLGYTEQVVKLL